MKVKKIWYNFIKTWPLKATVKLNPTTRARGVMLQASKIIGGDLITFAKFQIWKKTDEISSALEIHI